MNDLINFFENTFVGWFVKVAILLGGLNWLFTKKFVGEYAKQTVELMFLGNKTEVAEAIKGGFAKQQQELIAELNRITTKQLPKIITLLLMICK